MELPTRVHWLMPSFTLIHVVSIRDVFKQALKRHLGGEWYQLATAMKIPKTEIDSINQSPHELVWKINCFLTKYKLPSFKSDRKTAEFIIEALERASLPTIATDVMRDLEHDLKIEGTLFEFCIQSYII